ncbi:hypothetical protein ACFQMN_11390 [Halobacillus campisalis]|uniref:Uncharacterized protein n=1 Tax=Halobacillus campisalis TaxID=435909 RepID=A0ABW2K5N3_9BACI|nr:hypothetical protein [Halobacillus campisalis]
MAGSTASTGIDVLYFPALITDQKRGIHHSLENGMILIEIGMVWISKTNLSMLESTMIK